MLITVALAISSLDPALAGACADADGIPAIHVDAISTTNTNSTIVTKVWDLILVTPEGFGNDFLVSALKIREIYKPIGKRPELAAAGRD